MPRPSVPTVIAMAVPLDPELRLICASPDVRPSVQAVLRGFVRAQILDRFVTTYAYRPDDVEDRWLAHLPEGVGSQIRRELARRSAPDIPRDRIAQHPMTELVRTAAGRVDRTGIVADRVWEWSERRWDRWVGRQWAGRAPFIYGYEFAGLETFRAQKQHGGFCLLGQVIAHHRTANAILAQEIETFPGAATAYDRHILGHAMRIGALKDEQYGLSDLIVANSDFVRDTFIEAGIPAEKVISIPMGAPDLPPLDESRRNRDSPVFLSVGQQSLRKGTHYLLDAWRRLAPGRAGALWLVGKYLLPEAFSANLPGEVRRLSTLPRSELPGIYRQASALVLPTLCEGFAMVILEAMAHGLAIITTRNSGCGDFVQDGVNGWIVPIRDPEALADRLAWCFDHPDEVRGMGRRSREKAAGWNWDNFADVHGSMVKTYMRERLNGG